MTTRDDQGVDEELALLGARYGFELSEQELPVLRQFYSESREALRLLGASLALEDEPVYSGGYRQEGGRDDAG